MSDVHDQAVELVLSGLGGEVLFDGVALAEVVEISELPYGPQGVESLPVGRRGGRRGKRARKRDQPLPDVAGLF